MRRPYGSIGGGICEDTTYGVAVIQGDHNTLPEGTLASFEVKFDMSVGVANRHGRVPEQLCQAGGGEPPEPPEGGVRAHGVGLLGGQIMKSQFMEYLPSG